MISLFKQKRTKGWWPLYIKTDNDGLLLQVCIFNKSKCSYHLWNWSIILQYWYAEKRRNRSNDQSLQTKENKRMVASLHKNWQRWTFAAGVYFHNIKSSNHLWDWSIILQHQHAEEWWNCSDDQSLQAKEDQRVVASLHKNRQRWTIIAGLYLHYIKKFKCSLKSIYHSSAYTYWRTMEPFQWSVSSSKRGPRDGGLYIKTDNDGLLLQVCIFIT